MLNLLLKLYPARFVENMGEDWLRDTRQELAEARQQGGLAYLKWVGRVALGTIQGVWQAHRNEYERACERGIEVQCGNQVLLIQKGSNAHWIINRHVFLSGVGATIAGYVGFKFWLAAWVNGALDQEVPDAGFSLMLCLYLGGMLVFIAAGLWMSWTHRVHLRSIKSRLLNLAWMAFVAQGAWGIAFINWTLVDLGMTSSEATQVFEDYPHTLKAMGLQDDAGESREWVAMGPQDPRCDRALAVLDLSKHQAMRGPANRRDVVALLLVDSMANNLWVRGCMTDDQRIAFNHTLMGSTQLNDKEQRQLAWRGLGQLAESRSILVNRLALKQEGLCLGRAMREHALAGTTPDTTAIAQACQALPNAQERVSANPDGS